MTSKLSSRIFSKAPVKLLLAGVILGILGWRMDWKSIGEIAQEIKIEYFISALLLMAGQVLFLALRWEYFMNAEERLVGYKDALNMSGREPARQFHVHHLGRRRFVTFVFGPALRHDDFKIGLRRCRRPYHDIGVDDFLCRHIFTYPCKNGS